MSESTRKKWIKNMHKIVYPVISNAANGSLHNALPVSNDEKKRGVAYLEAIGRAVDGIAPWAELNESKITDDDEEGASAQIQRTHKKGNGKCRRP